MGLNNSTNLYSIQGIDVNNVNSTANRILAKSASQAEKKEPVVQSIDYSKFNRNTLGINLYSSRTSVDLQKQVSQIQAGLYAQSIDVSKLNSFAAQNLYSAAASQKSNELIQIVQSAELQAPIQIQETVKTVKLSSTFDKKSSSNGFNPFKQDDEEENKSNK